ncbi:MAG: recombinase family protein [Clostridia bacterium]|nr:recombinase family protein [Clostridia bacterium]
MKKTITKLDALPKLTKKTRVAAYARVSSGKDAMLQSLAAQVSYYKKLIQENKEWEFIGVYADEALTGTKDSREEFQQLLTDCRAGQVDMIITKSISRFARNTLTLLETVRELKSLNIDVFFEEQNIHSNSGEGEMILTFLATFAQEESRSTSENMKWRIKKDFEQGIMWGGKSCLGYMIEDKKPVVIPKEAATVKLIYQLYLDGKGADAIGKILDLKGIKPQYASKWNRSSIMHILTNYNYTGDLILQKTFRENHLTKRKIINSGEYDQYAVKNNHEPIISKEVFDKVQTIKRERAERTKPNPNKKPRVFKGMLKCGICGRTYTHKSTPHNEIWKCSLSVTKGIEACPSKQVPDTAIKEVFNEILNQDNFSEELFKKKVKFIIVNPDNHLVFHFKDLSVIDYQWEPRSRSRIWTPKMKEQARKRALKQHQGGAFHGESHSHSIND